MCNVSIVQHVVADVLGLSHNKVVCRVKRVGEYSRPTADDTLGHWTVNACDRIGLFCFVDFTVRNHHNHTLLIKTVTILFKVV